MKAGLRGRGLAAVAALLAGSGLAAAHPATPESTQHSAQQAVRPASEDALREAMRRLWSDHVFWTRDYVVAAIDGPADAAQAAAARLMKNQEDIGAAVASYYGADAGNQLTSLLKQHIQIAVDVVAAAKAGDEAKLKEADGRWQKNADDIAGFLSQANPNWPRPAIAEAMRMHLQTTTDEVVARLHHDYRKDVAAFDAVYDHILHMADVLTDGIVKQFPTRFAA